MIMSLIKKSDVKNHLSTRSSTLLPFKPASTPNVNSSGAELSGEQRSTPASDRASSLTMPATPIGTLIGSGIDRAAVEKPQA